ncbi:MAG: CvpA family protein [Bacteroidaceae bacterium]|nr:CvpA family protein [Bacteroidaceae bacterium]
MSTTDIIVLALLAWGAVCGFKRGLVKELASMAGFFLGLFISWKVYSDVNDSVIMFILIWIATPIILGMVATVITKTLDFTIVGGLMNRLLGAVAGVVKWGFLIGVLALMADKVQEWKTLLETL